MGMSDAYADPAKVAEAINNLQRGPFREILATALSADPTPQEIRKFAAKYPDRWAQMLTMLAKLSGYNDKIEIDISINRQISLLSDADLITRLAALEQRIAGEIDVTPALDSNPSSTQSNAKTPDKSDS